MLIVGNPETIPFRFQYQLSVEFAVGRLYFESLEEYAQYAANVVAAEVDSFRTSRSVTFFGTANEDDGATQASASQLVKPLLIESQPQSR